MPVIFKKYKQCVPPVSTRWNPIYLEHGRLEVDDSSIKWISSDDGVMRIPVARITTLVMGPGSTVTHAAIAMCARMNTVILWVGDDNLHFYAYGVSVNEKCITTMRHAELYADLECREQIAIKMFKYRFGQEVEGKSIEQLRGMEGFRVKKMYRELSEEYGVAWIHRNSSDMLSHIIGPQDDINKMITISNFYLYSICLSVCLSMGYLPALGFIHVDGKTPFIYDVADLVKDSFVRLCFKVYSREGRLIKSVLSDEFKKHVKEKKVIEKLPNLLKDIMC